jgi:hypothetical protein
LARDAGGFRSATGDVTAAATFTDNALNTIPDASQSIALQGKRLSMQTIMFTQNAPAQVAYNSSFIVAATGGASGNPVTFTSSGSCSNSGAIYTMTSGAGTCSVIANQAGNSDYVAAPAVTETVAAVAASQTIAFNQNAPVAADSGESGHHVHAKCSFIRALQWQLHGCGNREFGLAADVRQFGRLHQRGRNVHHDQQQRNLHGDSEPVRQRELSGCAFRQPNHNRG